MIKFDCNIYMDALGLLLSDKTDIKTEILAQLQQGDECINDVTNDIYDISDRQNTHVEPYINHFENDSCENLIQYISFDENTITFDYEESSACENLRVVAFRIPCTFDTEKYITDIQNKI